MSDIPYQRVVFDYVPPLVLQIALDLNSAEPDECMLKYPFTSFFPTKT